MTISSIAIIMFAVSLAGIVGMVIWRWVEERKKDQLSKVRYAITHVDRWVVRFLFVSKRHVKRTMELFGQGVFTHLPKGLLQVSVVGCRTYNDQYTKLCLTLEGGRRKRNPSRNASEYMRSLAASKSLESGKEV